MKDKGTVFTAYRKDGRKLVKIGTGKTKKEVNKVLETYVDEYEVDKKDVFIIIYYGFTYKGFFHGPLIMTCEIKTITDKGKISKVKYKVNGIHYLVKELKVRGFKIGDYKRLFNKLNSGEIESGFKKWYSAKDLDL
jgi:hypothetical protein